MLECLFPPDVDALSINIPCGATPDTPWRLTRLSRRRYFIPTPPDRSSGTGRPGYRMIENTQQAEPQSDVRALMVDHVVSVTPLSLDLTSRVDLDALASWLGAKQVECLGIPGLTPFLLVAPQVA